MKSIQRYILLAIILASVSFADSIGINLGTAYTDYSQEQKSGQIVLSNKPDKKFQSYELFYISNKDILNIKDLKPYLSYTYSKNDELKHQYLLVGLNKYYAFKDIVLYGGLLAGYGELKWKYNPLNNSLDNDYSANSFMAGIQTGIDYPIYKNWIIGLNLKYLAHSYKTTLQPDNTSLSHIKHKDSFIPTLSFRFSF